VEIGVWILVGGLTIALSYILQFSHATLSIGRALSSTDSKTGFQDAITPPWETNLALTIYIGIAVVDGITWWLLGWVSAVVALGIIFLGGMLFTFVFSRVLGDHYQRMIFQSMISRYANYLRDGDKLRADAMKHLLVKAGIDPDATRDWLERGEKPTARFD
jgi:hypothetical protein